MAAGPSGATCRGRRARRWTRWPARSRSIRGRSTCARTRTRCHARPARGGRPRPRRGAARAAPFPGPRVQARRRRDAQDRRRSEADAGRRPAAGPAAAASFAVARRGAAARRGQRVGAAPAASAQGRSSGVERREGVVAPGHAARPELLSTNPGRHASVALLLIRVATGACSRLTVGPSSPTARRSSPAGLRPRGCPWHASGVVRDLSELVGGLLLVLGLLTRPAAAVVSFTMVVAWATVHLADAAKIGGPGGPAFEYPFVLWSWRRRWPSWVPAGTRSTRCWSARRVVAELAPTARRAVQSSGRHALGMSMSGCGCPRARRSPRRRPGAPAPGARARRAAWPRRPGLRRASCSAPACGRTWRRAPRPGPRGGT